MIERSGELTAAQQRMWLRSYWWSRGELWPGWRRRWDLDGHEISVESARHAFARLVERHEILRTRFEIGPDGDPIQVVLAADRFRPPLSVLPLACDDGLYQPGRSLLVGVQSALPLWSVRLFVNGERVCSVVLEFDHILSDGSGLRTWHEQFLALAAGHDVNSPDTQPIDQPASRRGIAPLDLDHPFSGADNRAPQLIASGGAVPNGPRYVVTCGRYEHLLPLLDAATAVSPASRAQVLMVAIAVMLARYADAPAVHASTYIADRAPDDRGIECRMRPIHLLLEMPPERSLADVLGDGCRATLEAYARDLRVGVAPVELRARAAAARGQAAIMPLFVNFQDVTATAGAVAGAVVGGGASPRVQIADEWDHLGRPWSSMVWIYVEGDAVTIELDVDAAMLPVSLLHAVLDRLPALLEHISEHPQAPLRSADEVLGTGIVGAAPSMTRVGASWANVTELERILRAAPGVNTARCRVEDDRVVADLGDSVAAPFDVHEHVLAALQERLDVTAPSRYLFADGQTVEVPARWPALAPVTPAEYELCAALQETHDLGEIDLARSYLDVGGQLLRSPAVVEVLARRSWTGLGSRHFTGPRTLRSVARDLRPGAKMSDDQFVYLP